MPKYYYDCPIEAAYMAKKFGVRLYVLENNDLWDWMQTDCGKVYVEDASTTLTIGHHLFCINAYSTGKIYIGPDSEHIFKPQVGDGVVNCDDDPARVVRDGKEVGPYEVPLSQALKWVGREAKIIFREGKPFIWPKVLKEEG